MLKREDVFAYTSACFNGEPASCSYACPFRVDLRSVLKKAARGKLSAAAKELRQALPFPLTISTLCPHPCQDCCQRSALMGEEPVAIGLIEQACLAAPEKKERAAFRAPLQDRRIAVVGAGPAGLACALYLDRKRYPVTVFEQGSVRGGSLSAHPDFARFAAEFDALFAGSDVTFTYNRTISGPEELADYDAVCLCTGAEGSLFGLAPADDRGLGTSTDPRVFLCGEVAGDTRLEGMARALTVTRAIEAMLQSGDPFYDAEEQHPEFCRRYAPLKQAEPADHIVPGNGSYTAEEAAREAARCLQCDCEACMEACELLVRYKKKPPRIAQDVAQDGQSRNSVSSSAITRETWSCSLCGRCGSMCAEGVDLTGLFELSRRDRVESRRYPPALHAYRLREYSLSTGDGALTLPGPDGSSCRYLFFPGCRLGAADPAYVTKLFPILRSLEPDTGLMLNCCGIPALWAGEGGAFDRQLAFLKESWEELGKPTLVYACASCRRTFARFLPEIPLLSVYELLAGAELPPDSNAPGQPYAVFDPCAANGDGDLQQAVRRLAGKLGLKLTDYSSSGKCCGFGGHMQLANPGLYDEITAARCADAKEPFLVYCVNCAEVFRQNGKDCLHLLDAVLGRAPVPLASLEEKRQNTLKTRVLLEEAYLGTVPVLPAKPWDKLPLIIRPEALAAMERKLIPASDVAQAILQAEQDGYGFENEAGEVLCRVPGPALTCWVRYKPEGSAFRVLEVYMHRMHIREEEEA